MVSIISDDGLDVLPSYRFHSYHLHVEGDTEMIGDARGKSFTNPLDCLADDLITSEFAKYFWDKSH
jgi:hypothetical protein